MNAGELRQKGVDLRIATAVPHATPLGSKTQHQPYRQSGSCTRTPQMPQATSAALLEVKAAAATLMSKAPSPATWYSDLITPTPAPKRRPPPMRPPSPKPLRSLRSRRQSENTNANAGEIPAVAKHGHVSTDEAPGPGLRTRARRRAAMKLSPSDPASSHDTGSAGLGPHTPPPRPLVPKAPSPPIADPPDVEPEAQPWADEENGQAQVNGGVHVDLAAPDNTLEPDCSPRLTCLRAAELRATPWSSPTMTPVQCEIDAITGALPKRSPLHGATWSALQDPMISPAMRAVCSGLDLTRLDDSAVAMSPIASGLSPLALGLADLPSPLTALPALMSPLPDTLQVCFDPRFCSRGHAHTSMLKPVCHAESNGPSQHATDTKQGSRWKRWCPRSNRCHSSWRPVVVQVFE